MPIETQRFANAIIPGPDLAVLHLLVDSQLLDTFNMQYYEEWKGAQLMLLNFQSGTKWTE